GPGTGQWGRKLQYRYIQLLTHLGQHLPSSHQRLVHQTTPGVIEQIEQHIPHRTPLPRLTNPPRIGQPMATQQTSKIGPTVSVEGNQLAVHQRGSHPLVRRAINRLVGKRWAARYFRWQLMPLTPQEQAAMPPPELQEPGIAAAFC